MDYQIQLPIKGAVFFSSFKKTHMRYIITLLLTFASTFSVAQSDAELSFKRDSALYITKNPVKGFYHDYILFIPGGTVLNKKIYLLVEPNNTGIITDSIEIHKKAALDLAFVSSVGNNVAAVLKIPLLVPVFPRPASQPLMYTHALDRDVMLKKTPALKRLDLQLLEMINNARDILLSMNILVHTRFFMNGFSASATFTNRFSFIHPDKIKALAIGGFNGELILPQDTINNIALNYPIGTNDFRKLFGTDFKIEAYRQIAQFIYMGRLDENDAVQFDDAYSKQERKIINDNIGTGVQGRYVACQEIYCRKKIDARFITYENTGHWTTGAMNIAVARFFNETMQGNNMK